MTSRAFDLGPLPLYFASAKPSHFKRFRQALVSLNLIAQRREGGKERTKKKKPELQITPSLPLPHLQQPKFEHKHAG